MKSSGFAAFDDLELLLSIRRGVAEARRSAAPAVMPIYATCGITAQGCRMAVFAGSFNPLTTAHEALVEQALNADQCDETVISIAVHTIDKTEQRGASLLDRLVSLVSLARDSETVSVAVTNLGLYLDQAIAYRRAFPKLGGLTFLVGFDKIVQLFDPRYYRDRDRELARLFKLARFTVAPRGDNDRSDLDNLLQISSNRPFSAMVGWLPLASDFTRLSSSALRSAAGGIESEHGLSPHARPATEAGAYSTDADLERRYEARQALIEAIALMGDEIQRRIDFRTLMRWLRAGDPRIRPIIDELAEGRPLSGVEELLAHAGLLALLDRGDG